jgi:hypothetical protein
MHSKRIAIPPRLDLVNWGEVERTLAESGACLHSGRRLLATTAAILANRNEKFQEWITITVVNRALAWSHASPQWRQYAQGWEGLECVWLLCTKWLANWLAWTHRNLGKMKKVSTRAAKSSLGYMMKLQQDDCTRLVATAKHWQMFRDKEERIDNPKNQRVIR